MTRKLKCWIGNYDGLREGLVIAHNQKEASQIAGCGVKTFADYYVEQEMCPVRYYDAKAFTLYTRPFDSKGAQWVEGRCKIERKARA